MSVSYRSYGGETRLKMDEPAKGSRIRMLIVGPTNWKIEDSFQSSQVTEWVCGSRVGSSTKHCKAPATSSFGFNARDETTLDSREGQAPSEVPSSGRCRTLRIVPLKLQSTKMIEKWMEQLCV
jgi:hypothetical protein